MLEDSVGKISNTPKEMKNFNREMKPIKIKDPQRNIRDGKHFRIKNYFDVIISRLEQERKESVNNNKYHRNYLKSAGPANKELENLNKAA